MKKKIAENKLEVCLYPTTKDKYCFVYPDSWALVPSIDCHLIMT